MLKELLEETTPTDELTMEQMYIIAEPFDLASNNDDVLGELMTDIEEYME